jgi:glycosyltransferase involved in cell wall biosynthesis
MFFLVYNLYIKIFKDDKIMELNILKSRMNSKKDLKTNINSLLDPGTILQINPQGVVGLKALEYMNSPGTTTLGGQIPYVLNQGLALSKYENVKLKLIPTSEERVQCNFIVKRPFHVKIASQRVYGSFGNDFIQKSETVHSSHFEVLRYPLFEKNGKPNPFIDKEAVGENGQNSYYTLLKNWGVEVAKDALEKKKIPGKIILNYWDSFVAYHAMLEYWHDKGLTKLPKTVAIPHSLGYRKLTTMLLSDVKKDLITPLKSETPLEKQEVIDSINKNLEKLLDDPKTCFPARILIEREMFSHPEIKGSLNSELELKEQLLSGPYIMNFKETPPAKPSFSKVISPGIDTLRFGSEDNSFMLQHESFAKKVLTQALIKDIPIERRALPIILLVGRLNFDKNFHGVTNAFLNSETLSKKANLVFVINGKDKHQKVNYIHEMQKWLKKNPEAQKELLASFVGSSRTQLENLAHLLDTDHAKGKYTSVSLPDGCDFAGLQRYLGKNSMAVSGLFSFKEPYGLAPLESMISGIPVVVSKFSGVAPEVIQAGGEPFNPNHDHEIAQALEKTIDQIHEKRKLQMEFAKNKTWEGPAAKLIDLMHRNGEDSFHDVKSIFGGSLQIDSPNFIQKGKELLRLCIKNEVDDAVNHQKGSFKDLIALAQ